MLQSELFSMEQMTKIPSSDWAPPTLFPSLKGRKVIAIDTETKDPDLIEKGPGTWRDAHVVGISICIEEGAFYYPIRHEGGGNLDPDIVLRWAKKEFGNFDGYIVGAHILYDLELLWKEGVVFPNATPLDILVAEPLLDNSKFRYDLDSVALTHLGVGKNEELLLSAAKAFGLKNHKRDLYKLPARYAGSYAEDDAKLAYSILPRQLKLLEKEGLLELFDMECGLIPLLLKMRQRGVRVDLDRAEQVGKIFENKKKAIDKELKSISGVDVEIWAASSLGKACDAMGIEYPRTPKTNAPSFVKDFLENHPSKFLNLVREGRKNDKMKSTFIDGHILGHAVDGVVHCEFHQAKGEKGGTPARFSSSNPNLQQIPSKDKVLAPLVRSIFIPEDDEDWVRHDQSQMEYRLLAHYAIGKGAEEARRSYNKDPTTDFHELCRNLARAVSEEIANKDRKIIKNTNFCIVYGGGLETTARTLGMGVDETRQFLENYHRALPFVKKTYRKFANQADRDGFVLTILGRKRRFNLWESLDWQEGPALPLKLAKERYGRVRRSQTHKALNAVMQDSNADVMKKSMVDTWQSGICDVLGAPLLTVHDELDWSVPRTNEAREAIQEARNVMETCVKLRVPVLVEESIGNNWGEASD